MLLSVLVAMIGSFTALTHAQRMRENSGRSARVWMVTGGITLGFTIWSMHFIGMLAFHLPIPVSYDLALTLLSVLPAIAAALLGFYVLHEPKISNLRIVVSGLVMGAGISSMHYTGMAALKMSPEISYDPVTFVLSVTIAIIASWGALLMMYQGERIKLSLLPRFALGGVIMGLAISGMHYTAMFGANIQPNSMCMAGAARVAPDVLAIMVSLICLLWFGGCILATLFDQRMARQNAQALAQLEQAHLELQARAEQQAISMTQSLRRKEERLMLAINISSIGFFDHDLVTDTLYWSPEMRIIFGLELDEPVNMNTPIEATYPADREMVEAAIRSAYNPAGSSSTFLSHRIVRRDGSVRWVEVQLQTHFSDTGEPRLPIRAVGAIRDITERKLAEQAMQDQQVRLNGIVDAAMDAIVSTDENQNIIIFNHGAEQMFGYRAADIIGQHLDLLVPIRFRETHSKHVDEYGRTGITTRTMNQPGQSYGLRASGEEFPFEATISRVEVAGKIIYTAILRDITRRKQAESELRIAATAFESQEGMLVTDANGVILRVNQAFTETTGYTAEEAVGQTPRLLKSGRHNADFYRAMWETIHRTGKWQGEVWDRRKNDEIYPKWLTITAVKGDNGAVTHYVGSHVDITERKAAEDEVKNLAFYDPLTRLPNRRLLLDRLDHALASSTRSGREGALMFIDLDNFKTLNDTLGHNMGDLLLQHVAQRLGSCVREGDTVARLGGDEFVVLLEDLSKDTQEAAAQTEAIGEKILATLNQTYQLATHEYHSTPSIGATLFTDHQFGVDVLFKQADIAMYQSKKAGRNTLRFFDPQMQDTVNARSALESELHKALENQQFQLYYQIQVDDSHRPLGAEALIRWVHPEHGLVSPAQFIPLAEETGLILPIGQWVLETACAQIKAWQQEESTRDLVLAVNVSARQFRQADFVAQVQAIVQHHAINPKRLKLELTESLLQENIEDTIAVMDALKEIGVRFSLDDFGTGYSSLQYLKRLPLDQLKIDRSFVRDIATDSSDKAIVRTIIAMAHSLNLDVIAEGVETEEQRQFLLDTGCTKYQGFMFSKPVPLEQFEALLTKC